MRRRHRAAMAASLLPAALGGCKPAPRPPAEHAITAPPPTTDPSTSTSSTTATEVPATSTTAVTAPPTTRRLVVTVPRTTVLHPVEQPAEGATRGDIAWAIRQAFGTAGGTAVAVAMCESGLRPGAINGPHRGLFQINVRIHANRISRMGYSIDQMLEPLPNIAVAAALYREQGWRPWTCARKAA